MNLLKEVSTLSSEGNLNVLIECKKGTHHKYEYIDGILTVVRDLDKHYKYPFNYGCVPNTLASDHDPLDAIVISEEPFEPTTIVECKVFGIVKMMDNGEEDHKLLCIPLFSSLKKVNLQKILKYLDNYKYPYQSGTKILGVYDSSIAWQEIHNCIINHNNNNNSFSEEK